MRRHISPRWLARWFFAGKRKILQNRTIEVPNTESKLSSLTLCFCDKGMEQAYVRKTVSDLKFKVCICSCAMLLYLFVVVAYIVSDWDGSGSSFTPSPATKKIAFIRNISMVGIAFLCVLTLILTSLPARLLSPQALEVFVVTILLLTTLASLLQHPYMLISLERVELGSQCDSSNFSDFKLMLNLDVLVSITHLVIPLRWKVLVWFEVAVELGFIWYVCMYCSWKPSPANSQNAVTNSIYLLVLIVSASVGSRNIEFHRRVGFAQVAYERTQRCSAERMLAASIEFESNRKAIDGGSSHRTSTYTAELFASAQESKSLHNLMSLGFREHWLVPCEDLQLDKGQVLGCGSFGFVVSALYYGAEVVLKGSRGGEGADLLERCSESMLKELRIFRRLRHPNIVLFYGACIEPSTGEFALVLERVHGEQLCQYITEPPGRPSTESRCSLLCDIASALSYLHSHQPPVVHGDIKSSNVMVERLPKLRAKLVDFGLGLIESTHSRRRLGGTLRWVAPEVIQKDLLKSSMCAASADVFSFGRIIFMIMTGRSPLLGVHGQQIVRAIEMGGVLELDWCTVPLLLPARNLSTLCCMYNPWDRPKSYELHASIRQWLLPGGGTVGNCVPSLQGGLDFKVGFHNVRSNLPSRCSQRTKQDAHRGVELVPDPKEVQDIETHQRQLLHSELEATPDSTKKYRLVMEICSWNIAISTEGCCAFHRLVREAQLIICELAEGLCHDGVYKLRALDQCRNCKVLLEPGKGCNCELE